MRLRAASTLLHYCWDFQLLPSSRPLGPPSATLSNAEGGVLPSNDNDVCWTPNQHQLLLHLPPLADNALPRRTLLRRLLHRHLRPDHPHSLLPLPLLLFCHRLYPQPYHHLPHPRLPHQQLPHPQHAPRRSARWTKRSGIADASCAVRARATRFCSRARIKWCAASAPRGSRALPERCRRQRKVAALFAVCTFSASSTSPSNRTSPRVVQGDEKERRGFHSK
mmetsp:Transcript_28353/g.45652  ORF Transcript_28353/g.45652 Transcript_28353/m.45652 type:complete len:222 (+) Transcript_28353:99-764(+)